MSDDHKQALWFVLKTLNLENSIVVTRSNKRPDTRLKIEGRDKEFAQEMSQQILDLPLQIRQAIAAKYGTDMVSNIHYEPSRLDILLDNEAHKQCCACSVALAETVIGYYTSCSLIRYNPVCMFICSPIILPMFCVLYKCMNRCLTETAEEKDKQCVFEAIPLLKDMEYTIAEAKEKQD